MPARGEKMRALLATGRFANLPTVWSNVLAGFWLAWASQPAAHPAASGSITTLAPLLILMLACSMIYVAGCMLGDARDLAFDLKNRPERPIPRGILTARGIQRGAFILFGLALGLLFLSGLFTPEGGDPASGPLPGSWTQVGQNQEMLLGLLLTVTVISYAILHKKNKAAALIMMGTCRFLLVVLAMAFARHHSLTGDPVTNTEPIAQFPWQASPLLIPAMAVAAYTILLSWVASTESRPGVFQSRKLLCVLLLAVPACSLAGFSLTGAPSTLQYSSFSAALVLYYLWLFHGIRALKTSKPVFVSRALAGFCLLDACYVAPVAPVIAMICLVFFVLALILQRVAPAT